MVLKGGGGRIWWQGGGCLGNTEFGGELRRIGGSSQTRTYSVRAGVKGSEIWELFKHL